MSDLAAAMGIHQLHRADPLHQRRGELAGLYRESLAEVEEIMLPQTQPNRNHSWHLFVIRLKLDRLQIDRDQFVAELARSGIATFVHWLPLHMHPYYRATYGYAPEDLPVARRVYLGMITLPLYPEMTEEQVRYVGDSIKDIITRNRATVLFGHGQDQLLLTKKGA
jgi:perosamine synthetase